MPKAGGITQDSDLDAKAEKKKLLEERKKLKEEQKNQKKEAKRRAKEISAKQAELSEDEESGGVSVVLVTTMIVLAWIAILAFLVKLDIGGFGSTVLAPILKDVPVINKILPADSKVEVDESEQEAYGGYTSLKDAVDYIKELELQLQQAQAASTDRSSEVEGLQAEVNRLKEFEDKQVEFQRLKNEFFEDVVYAENGPGPEEYRKYYEEIDPSTAEYLYKQVVQQSEQSQQIKDFAQTYSAMKPKEAAGIFEAMTDNLDLVAQILDTMSADDRGGILGVMDPDVAARLTKLMDPAA